MATARAMWKGEIHVGEFAVPVRMVSAVEPEASGVSFHTAHRCADDRLTRLQQKRWCASCAREVPLAEVASVYEHAAGQLVEITKDDLKECEDASSTVLQLTAVVDEAIDPIFVETTAYLVEDGLDAAIAFETLRSAIGEERAAIGVLVLNKRSTHVALQPVPSGFLVYLLRDRGQVRDIAMLVTSGGLDVTPHPTHVRLARQLLATLPSRFAYADLEDKYSVRVRDMVRRKVNTDVGEQLAASLAAAAPAATKKRGKRATRKAAAA